MVRVSEEVHEMLKARAAAEQRSVGVIIERAVKREFDSPTEPAEPRGRKRQAKAGLPPLWKDSWKE